MAELVEIVDDAGVTLGTAPRSDARLQQLRYRVALAAAFLPDGTLITHRRPDDAASMPGHWDIAAGGAVTPGEDPEAGIRRELHEELGVAVSGLADLGAAPYNGVHRTWVHRYLAHVTGPLHTDPNEVADVRVVDAAGLEELAAAEPLCPDSSELFFDIVRHHLNRRL